MTRATLDTNVLVSALVFGGLPRQLLSLSLSGRFRIVTSPALLDELEEKLRLKFRWSMAHVRQTRFQLEEVSDVISTLPTLRVILDDPDDDRVLECAVAGHAD